MAENDILLSIRRDCFDTQGLLRYAGIASIRRDCSGAWSSTRLVDAAEERETQWALQLLAPVASRLGRVETVFADQAYQGLEEKLDRELGWELQVFESDGEASGFSIDPKQWIVERTYG